MQGMVILDETETSPLHDSLSIEIKRICIEIILSVHTMEINPYFSKAGSETVYMLWCGLGYYQVSYPNTPACKGGWL